VALAWGALAISSGALLSPQTLIAARVEGFAARKKIAALPSGPVAYLDEGEGPPLVLLHGCPFSAVEWEPVLQTFSQHFRVIAPDLRGLGDTPVRLDDDYRLPTDVTMVRELLASLGVTQASFVAHDHGAAVLQLLTAEAPQLVDRAVISNAEAYDAWPSAPELPYLRLIVNPVTSPIAYLALQLEAVRREVFSIAVFDQATLSSTLLAEFTEPHVATPARWQRLRRFYRWQLDPEHQTLTLAAVPALRRFDRPVLLIWGARDTNFDTQVASRLAHDLSGTQGIVLLNHSSHLPMVEQPVEFARAASDFLTRGSVSTEAVAALAKSRGLR